MLAEKRRTARLPHLRPEIRGISFSTATIRSGRVVAAKIDCAGIRPEELRCEAVGAGFRAEVLPDRARLGPLVILAVRVHRELGTPKGLCLLRFRAGAASATASLTVLR